MPPRVKWCSDASALTHNMGRHNIVRDSSAVRRHWVFFVRAVGRQRALHTENSGLLLQLCVDTFPRFVAIRFYFLSETFIYKSLHQSFFYSFITILPSEIGVTLDYSTICLRPYHFAIWLSLSNICPRDFEKTTITAMYHGRWFAYKQTNKYLYCQS